MVDDVLSVFGEMFKMLFGALWELLKFLGKALYHFLLHHHRYAFLLPVLLITAFQRFSYINSASLYLAIAERDLTLLNALFEGKPMLIGSAFSNTDFALGPAYQYLLVPSIWTMGIDPLGPAILASLFGIATVYLVYLTGKLLFNLQAGLFAAGLYAVSSFVITYVYQTWSIDIVPFFVTALLLILYHASASARPFLLFSATGLLFGICLQLYHLTTFLVVIIPLYMLITEIFVKGKHFFMTLLRNYAALLLGFLVSFLPYLYHEFTNGFANLLSYRNYILEGLQNTSIGEVFIALPQTFLTLFARLILNYPSPDQAVYYSATQLTLMEYFAIILIIFTFVALIFVRNRFVLLLLGLWLLVGTLFFSFYQEDVYAYHFTPLFPVIAIFAGYLLASLFRLFNQDRVKMAKQLISSTAESETYTTIPVDVTDKKKLYLHWFCVFVSVWLFVLITLLNFSLLPLQVVSEEQETRAKEVAELILNETEGNPYNFAHIATPHNRGNVYKRALRTLERPPRELVYEEIDPERKTVTEQLMVVCEDLSCKPLDSTLWEIQGFGKAVIIDDWDVAGVKVYRLIHPIERR